MRARSPDGWSKIYALQYVDPENFKEVHFFGDKTYKGGNDYVRAPALSLLLSTVLSPQTRKNRGSDARTAFGYTGDLRGPAHDRTRGDEARGHDGRAPEAVQPLRLEVREFFRG